MRVFALIAVAALAAGLAWVTLGGNMTEISEPDTRQWIGDNQGSRVAGAPWASRSAVIAPSAMAATSHPLATQIAIDTLKVGGSAMDAAIAANAALGLMEPTGNGIGGDIFAIVWDPKTQKLHGYNGSGRSPKGRSLEDMRAEIARRGLPEGDIPDWGSLSVTVPGTVDGWFALHGRFGKLSMAEVLAPAVSYARRGHPVHETIAYYLGFADRIFQRRLDDKMVEEIDNFRSTYLPDGRAPVEGQLFKNPDLANTLETIGSQGRDAFYKGDLARTMDAYMKRIGGDLRYEDFASHTGEWVDPVSVNYRGYDVWELPPNGQGVAALQMLQILEGFDLAAMGQNSADATHVMVEAKKLAFEDRAKFYADPAYDKGKINLDYLLSKEYGAERAKLIDMKRAAEQVDHGDPQLIEGDTIYLTVADKDGMMVSLIQSNYRGMGSGLVPDGLGFMFQDRGAQFSLTEGHANVYAPGKRPFHTIIPAFITKDGDPLMSFGLMGGAMQPQGHVQIVVNLVDFDLKLQAAGDAARFNHEGSTSPTWQGRMTDGGVLQLEAGFKADVVADLEARGHKVLRRKGPFGGYQAIWRDPKTGVYWGATEMRKDGMAQGY